MTLKTAFYPIKGGLDIVTPAIAIQPGKVIACLNYEPTASGYRRVRGYERFDGQPAPSEAICYKVNIDDGGTGSAVTQILTDNILKFGIIQIGYAVADAVLVSGAWGTSTAVGYVMVYILANKLGTWADNMAIKVGSVTVAYANGLPAEETASQGLAAEKARSFIKKVGEVTDDASGPVRGVHFYDGDVLAARDNSDASAGMLYKSVDSGGWQAADIAGKLAFTSGGTQELRFDDHIVGDTSSAGARVKGVVLESGSWAGGDAAGYLWVGAVEGTFQAETISVTLGANFSNIATIGGEPVTPSLPNGGHYEFVNHNFYAVADRECAYFVNGVGYAFEYDGLTLNRIETGQTTDTPTHLAVHKGSLFLSYPGGVVDFSAVGEPLIWDTTQGAGEFGVGDEITGMVENVGVLTIFGDTTINNLYGNDSSDYQLENFSAEAGGLEWTMQKLGQVYYMDNSGVRSLQSSQAYGNFTIGTITQLVEPLIEDYRRDGVEPVASIVSRRKGQYWVFFDNEEAIVAYLGGEYPEVMRVNFGKLVTCICSVEIEGVERIFFGSDDGYVYELDKGTSFDGEEIEYYARFPFVHFGAPQVNKRLHKVTLEMQTIGTASIDVSVDFDYGSVPGTTPTATTVTAGGGAIDDTGSNELYYSSQIEAVAELHIAGLARNFSLKVAGSESDEEPHVLQGMTWHIAPRGLVR